MLVQQTRGFQRHGVDRRVIEGDEGYAVCDIEFDAGIAHLH
jgi:hypothetical protein